MDHGFETRKGRISTERRLNRVPCARPEEPEGATAIAHRPVPPRRRVGRPFRGVQRPPRRPGRVLAPSLRSVRVRPAPFEQPTAAAPSNGCLSRPTGSGPCCAVTLSPDNERATNDQGPVLDLSRSGPLPAVSCRDGGIRTHDPLTPSSHVGQRHAQVCLSRSPLSLLGRVKESSTQRPRQRGLAVRIDAAGDDPA